MPSAESPQFLQALDQLEATRRAYIELLGAIPDADWERPISGERWSVKQELTHVVQVLNAVCRAVDRGAAGRRYSYLWFVPTQVRNLANGCLVLPILANNATRESIKRSYQAAHARLLASLEGLPEAGWAQGTCFPRKYRTVSELANCPVEHFEEHREHLLRVLEIEKPDRKIILDIRKYQASDWETVRRLKVTDNQLKFVGTISKLFEDKPASWVFHVIEVDDKIVGFFNLDTGYAAQYTFARQGELGLRAFFIDASYQGLGYGKSAVEELQTYLQDYFSGHPSICLTVNSENPEAYHIYLVGGFQDTGELYHGGAAGPQHILRMSIK